MITTDSLRKARRFFTKNYTTAVRSRGEHAMDTLLGTMIGVLFLAVISASFAGIFMAYTISTNKAQENTNRAAVVDKIAAEALNGLYVDATIGKAAAEANGWTVTAQSVKGPNTSTVPLKSKDNKTNPAYADYTFAARKPMVEGGTLLMSQWGVLSTTGAEKGLVKLYTAVAKAGQSSQACDWTQIPEDLTKYCVVVYDVQTSVVAPPDAYTVYADVNWEESITVLPWSSARNFYTPDWKTNIGTGKIGDVNTNGFNQSMEVHFVALVKDLTPGFKVALDFRRPGEQSFYAYTFTPQANQGETGKLERAVYGKMTVPAGTTSMEAYIDTKVEETNNANDPQIQLSRFFVYQVKY